MVKAETAKSMAAPSKFWPIVTVPIENESDVVAVRQRAADRETLRQGLGVEDKFCPAAARVSVGVAGQFRHCRGDAGLVLPVKPQQFGDAMRWARAHRSCCCCGAPAAPPTSPRDFAGKRRTAAPNESLSWTMITTSAAS
jgi:hypothetical protein